MDANRQRFWLLADEHHWPARSQVDYRGACRALHLASERSLGAMVADAAAIANSALERLPHAIDHEGATVWWDEAAAALQVRSHLPGAATLLALPERPQDFAPGHDDVLYIALAGRLLLHDLRARWPDFVLPTPSFQAWRIAAAPGGGAWLLERGSGRLARLRGCLQAARPAADYAAATFRPEPENADAPRLHLAPELPWPSGERPQAIAANEDGRLALLSWSGDGECRLRLVDADGPGLGAPQALAELRFAYAIDWLGDGGIALRVPGRRDAPVFRPRATNVALTLQPSGEIYPLQPEAEEAPFAHRLDQPPRYPVLGPALEPLHRLSVSRLARRGEVASFSAGQHHLIDSGDAATVWHRLYAEARLPADCGFVVWLAASAEPSPADIVDWEPHVFGTVPAAELPAGPLPRAAWDRLPSELPGHPGLGAWGAPQPGRAGLWTVLIQRHGRRVRALRGRYLWLRLTLHGNGRDSPEIAALRAYGPRFPVRDQYLPRLYHETEFGAAADARIAPGEPYSTPADFLERFLGNVEGWLTALEDRVAAAHLVSDPDTATEPSLDWLGSWIGVAFDPALPATRRRDWLRHAAELARFHGTRRGLLLALDLATDGGVRAGRLVVIEGFRIRRLLVTLLGVDLNVEDDPLLPGLVISGNSVVGDTLILGEAERVELLALFRAEVSIGVANALEREAVLAFYERLAYRTLVLVHGAQEGEDEDARGLLRRIVELEAPAHVEVQIARASWPLLTGIASLVGVDTWLGPPQAPQPARADHSTLGRGDRVLGIGSLDPRLSGAAAALAPLPRPVADAGADLSVAHGRNFTLDASGSRAPPGRQLTEYRWRLLG